MKSTRVIVRWEHQNIRYADIRDDGHPVARLIIRAHGEMYFPDTAVLLLRDDRIDATTALIAFAGDACDESIAARTKELLIGRMSPITVGLADSPFSSMLVYGETGSDAQETFEIMCESPMMMRPIFESIQ